MRIILRTLDLLQSAFGLRPPRYATWYQGNRDQNRRDKKECKRNRLYVETMSHSLRFAGIAAVVLLVLWQPLQAATKSIQIEAVHGMVASAHPLASEAGVNILKAGGNAIDAAVAAALMIGVVEPYGSGLGGEGTMVLYRTDTKTLTAVDYRSTAPAVTNYPEMIPKTGYAAAAVPGTIAGLATALEEYGTMKLHRVMAPAILQAEQGFTVSPALARIIMAHFADIMQNDALAKILCPDGLPLEAGGILKNPDLALTLRLIAAYGPDLFYQGELADAIAKEMADNGGFIKKADLSSYRAIIREPVRGMYRGHELVSVPPPSGGSTVIQILQILEHFDVAKNPPTSSSNIHLMTEAMKRGFTDFTAFIGDPDFERIPFDNLLSEAYARKRAAEIRADILSPAAGAGNPETARK